MPMTHSLETGIEVGSENRRPFLDRVSSASWTSDLLTQTETRNSRGACLKHGKTKSKSFTRRRQAPDDQRL